MAPEAEPGAPEDPNSGVPGNTHAQAGSLDRPPGDNLRVLVEPLPAHKVVLWLASERFQTQVERWSDGADAAGPSSMRFAAAEEEAGQQPQPVPHPQRPPPLQLRVPLGSEEELPAALAAIKFAYTGRIEAGSVREVLRVWQQADYLQMKGCVEACVAAVRETLAAPAAAAAAAVSADGASSVAGATESAGQAPPAASARAVAEATNSGEASSGDARSTSAAATAPPVLELYDCAALWPDPEQEPAFAALLTEARPQLVAHFGDALAVLNKQQLYDQMRALPAVGLEALLESDDFGNDSESSVVLVLAEWMQVNYGTTDAATRRRLCGLLRLSQCSRAYLDWVLPALALDHVLQPDTPLGWLPITPQQAGCIARYKIAPKHEQVILRYILGDLCGDSGPPEAWLRTKQRRQCVPSQGLSYRFVLDKQELVEKLAGLQPGHNRRLELKPDAEDARLGDNFQAMGLTWGLAVKYEHGGAYAGLWLSACLPAAYTVRHGECCSEASKLVRPVAPLRSFMYVQTCSGGQRGETLLLSFHEEEMICLGKMFGAGVEVIELATASVAAPAAVMQQQPLAAGLAERSPEQQEQGRQQGSAAEQQEQEQRRRAREVTVAAQWSKYIIEGRVTVRMLLRRHDAAAMA